MTFAQPFTDYEILDRIGAGAMGTVFKARHKKLSRIVALKVLKPSLARDKRYVDRLRREARIVASLNHPNIVTGYDLGEEGGYHFFVMEFVEGKSLRGLLAEWGIFPEEYVLDVATQIAEALDHAHRCSVIHRDIKPGNVLITEDGTVKLTDMGLAKGPADLTLTRDGAIVGTPQYISPEQARNPQDVDVRTDLYSLGATLYHMATGVPPHTGDTMAELIGKVIYDPPVPPNELNAALSEGFSLVLRKLLAKDLRVRYQTPRELLDDLERVRQELPPEVDADRLAAGEGERRSPWRRRSLIGALLLAMLGVAIWLGTQLPREEVRVASGDPFLERLDRDLARMSTPGERLRHLTALIESPPPGLAHELVRRHSRAFSDLQAAVDRAVRSFTGERWARFVEWVEAPGEWPDRARCLRERVEKTLAGEAGVHSSELPSTLDRASLEALERAIDELLAQRDAGMLRRLDAFLETSLATRAEERELSNDFVGAERVWRQALTRFCGQIGEPDLDKLSESTLRAARARCDRAAQAALPRILAKEESVAEAMNEEVATVARDFEARLAEGRDIEEVAEAVASFRQDLLQFYPASARFHPDRDPWRGSERRLRELQQRIRLAVAVAARERFERRCAFAWRALCYGEAIDAEAVLEGAEPPTVELATELREHRAVLRAAARVRDHVLAGIASLGRPILAFPRTGNGLGVPVFVDAESGRPTLHRQTERGARSAVLTEFRFGELLVDLRRELGRDPLAGLGEVERARGTLVLRMVADDLAGVGALLREAGDPFLVDDVWPILRRIRGERREVVLDREGLAARLREELARVRKDESGRRELQRAIASFESRVPEGARSPAERRLLRAARAWDLLVHRRERVREQIEEELPNGAQLDVSIDEAAREVRAEIAVGAEALLQDATGDWDLRDGLLEFAGGDRPWSELTLSRLRLQTGMPPRGRTSLQLEFAVPANSVGRRFYVVVFRGVSVMLVLTADDSVHAALVEGDVRAEDAADEAFDRAVRGVFDKARVLAVPGGIHRLTVDVRPSRTGGRAAVSVRFEGRELLREGQGMVALDPGGPVGVTLYPRQDMRVRRIVVRGRGL